MRRLQVTLSAAKSGLFGFSLDGNARRAIDLHEGEKVDEAAWKDFLRGSLERQRMIDEEPGLTGEAFQDAYVGAVGEHLARRWAY